jgi:tRNA(adenine34) deaminase
MTHHTTSRVDAGFEAASTLSAMSVHADRLEIPAPMAQALAEAYAALEHHDVPVGAVVVHRGEVIAARHNERELTHDPVAHAEILAMRDAATVLGQWRLDECTLYVTLEPCAMCAGAAVNARLGRLVYGAHDPKAGAVTSHFGLLDSDVLNHRVEVTGGVGADDAAELLRSFFRERRASASRER